jgi:uncharacterized protein (TIGR03435 family)
MRLLLMLVLLGAAEAQPAFEVASIKRGQPEAGVTGGCHGIDSHYEPNEAASAPPLGRCVIRNARLGHILRIAYRLGGMGLITGGPEWIKTGNFRYTIEAKAEDPTKATEEQLDQMLQSMIVERFALKFHRETKEVPGHRLIVGKNGARLKESVSEEVQMSFGPSGKPGSGPNSITARKYSIAKLAELLTMFGGPVIDQTGLTGEYDFKLFWDEDAGPTISTALEEQLGLKYEAQKVPVSYLVVESAQKPSDN